MHVRRTEKDGVSILHLEGEFDSFETSIVREGFEACLGDAPPAVVMDLGEMSFANSTTIAYLITAQRRAKELGGQVILARPREFFLKTLATLGLDQVFSIKGTVDGAVHALNHVSD